MPFSEPKMPRFQSLDSACKKYPKKAEPWKTNTLQVQEKLNDQGKDCLIVNPDCFPSIFYRDQVFHCVVLSKASRITKI